MFTGDADRAARMRTAASRLNFSYIERAPLPDFLAATDHSIFDYRKYGYHELKNILHGQLDNVAVSLFDYRYATPGSKRSFGRTYNQTIASLRQGTHHQSIFFKGNQLAEPQDIRIFLDEAFRAYREELSIQSQRDRARFHLQVELLSVQDKTGKPKNIPFKASVRARVVRLFRGDRSLRSGDTVMFNVTVIDSHRSPDEPIPKSEVFVMEYSKLLQPETMLEVFLDGQPPACHVPAAGELRTLTRPSETYFANVIHFKPDEITLKFYFNLHRLIDRSDMGFDWKNLFRRKPKSLPTHP